MPAFAKNARKGDRVKNEICARLGSESPTLHQKRKKRAVTLLLIRMFGFFVGAIIDRPQTTAKPKRATNGRPYKQISAEILFSLPIYVIIELSKSLPCVKGGGSRRLTNGL